MDNKFNRRKFLKVSSLSLTGLLLPSTLFFTSFTRENKSKFYLDDVNLMLKKAKIHLRKKEYLEAEKLYEKCLKISPNRISIYDAIQNLYSATKKTEEDIINLYYSGLKNNPKNPYFYDRIGRWLLRLELGNKKLAASYKLKNNIPSLFFESRDTMKNAIKNNKNSKITIKNYFSEGLDKVNRTIDFEADKTPYRINKKYKEHKRSNKLKHRNRYQDWDNNKIINKISLIGTKNIELFNQKENKRREKNIIKEKTFLFSLLYRRNVKVKKYDVARNIAKNAFEVTKKNSRIVGIYKKELNRSGDYNTLLNTQETYFNSLDKKNVWNSLAYISSIKKAFILDPSISLIEAVRLNEDLNGQDLIPLLRLPVIDSLSSLYCLQNNFEKARSVCYEYMDENTLGTTYAHLFLYISRSYFEQKDYNYCIKILNSIIGKENDNLSEKDNELITQYRKTRPQKLDRGLYYLLGKSYEKTNNIQGLNSVLQYLKNIDPKDSFLIKRIKIN